MPRSQRTRAHGTTFAITFLALLVQGPGTYGQLSYNANIMPLGDKEALMGNTGTGGLISTGAAFYNPAALTLLEGPSFSLSGSAYTSYKFSASPIATIGGTELEFSGSGWQSIPTSMIMVRSLGDWKVAFSLLSPTQFRYEGQQNWTANLNAETVRLKFLQDYSESLFMGGLTAARKLSGRWSLGLTVFGQYYSYLSSADLRIAAESDPSLIAVSTQWDQRQPIGTFAIAGLHWNGDHLDLGLRIVTPTIRIAGTSDYYQYSYNNFEGSGAATTYELDVTGARAEFRAPMDIRVGAAYTPNAELRVALDASYGAGVEYATVSDPRIELRERVDETYRLSLGVERNVAEERAFLAGLSFAPVTITADGSTTTYEFFSYSFGFKVTAERSETTIGFFRSTVNGDLPQAFSSERGSQKYEYLGVFLATNLKL